MSFGVNVGVFARYQLQDLLALQGELLYDLQGGGRHDFTESFETRRNIIPGPFLETGFEQTVTFFNRNVQLHTISLPISAKITPFDKESVTPYFLAGGSIEYIINAFEVRDILINQNGVTNAILTRQRSVISDDIENFQVGFYLGAGLDFYSEESGRVISVEFRYRQSLIDVNSSIDDFSSPLRPRLSAMYSSTFSINFYSTFKKKVVTLMETGEGGKSVLFNSKSFCNSRKL